MYSKSGKSCQKRWLLIEAWRWQQEMWLEASLAHILAILLLQGAFGFFVQKPMLGPTIARFMREEIFLALATAYPVTLLYLDARTRNYPTKGRIEFADAQMHRLDLLKYTLYALDYALPNMF